MFRNDKKAEIEAEERYLKALRKVKVPMLTLDSRWHQLFSGAFEDKAAFEA